ncbi:unnamed protein product [Pleuronectes platessa]|uniref:Uncharacterized protein n=1 Tax=Pleuronectes platessa TaxID=8262 RepID=A0A9N7UBF0_PLEPL|nr:unnamed protein product [Pleuronectes platessa]
MSSGLNQRLCTHSPAGPRPSEAGGPASNQRSDEELRSCESGETVSVHIEEFDCLDTVLSLRGLSEQPLAAALFSCQVSSPLPVSSSLTTRPDVDGQLTCTSGLFSSSCCSREK